MNLILLGAPGAGKGTQATGLSEILNIPHISTGEIFRDNIRRNTELGKLADSYISKGELVPDEVTIQIVKDRIQQPDCANGFILDGFPRTIVQAEMLELILDADNKKIDKVVNIVIDDEVVINRLSNRIVCPACGETYHLEFNPVEDNKCRKCGVQLVQRDDDKPDVIRNRIVAYHKKTEPLVEFYRNKGKLMNVLSENSIDESLQNTLYALGLKGI